MLLKDIKIVLNRVSEPGNVGAVCRVMKNMDLNELRLACLMPDISGAIATTRLDSHLQSERMVIEKIYARAVHAFDIWENACYFDNLAECVKDCSIVVGTTRRRGHKRKSISMTPRALAEWLAKHPGPAAIVFGNERTGLEDHELELCNFASHIPVSKEHPSLNLSHAVQIYAYELFLAMEAQNPVKGEWQAMTQEEISALVSSITSTLENIGFYKYPNKEFQARFLHDVISRAGLADREGRYLKNIFVKAALKD